MGQLTLEQSDLEVERLAKWLDEEEVALAIPKRVAFAVRLCVEEVVSNLIRYTSKTSEGLKIRLELTRQETALIAVIEDYGPPFDLRTATAYSPAKDLEAASVGGWGIHLIRSYADEIVYQSGPSCNRLKLIFEEPDVVN